MRLIVILGGPNTGLVVAETIAVLSAAGEDITLAGFLNDEFAAGTLIGSHPVLGGFEDWPSLAAGVRFISAFRATKQARPGYARLRALGIPNDRWCSVVDPAARVARGAYIGPGSYLAPNVVVEPRALVGSHTILRAGAYVSHDVRIGEFGFVGPNATLHGRTALGTGVHMAGNAVCREGTTVGDYAVIGIGAVVIEDVERATIVVGNPARPIGRVVEAHLSV